MVIEISKSNSLQSKMAALNYFSVVTLSYNISGSHFSLGRKEGHTNTQIPTVPGSNWGPYGQKAEILQLYQPFPP